MPENILRELRIGFLREAVLQAYGQEAIEEVFNQMGTEKIGRRCRVGILSPDQRKVEWVKAIVIGFGKPSIVPYLMQATSKYSIAHTYIVRFLESSTFNPKIQPGTEGQVGCLNLKWEEVFTNGEMEV